MRSLIDTIRLRPRTCVMEITFQCNMRCLHCASDVNSGWARGPELTLAEIKTVIDDLAALGCEHLTLSGGEALLRPDWSDIAKSARGLGLEVSMISNGFVINADVAREIREAGVWLVALSLDGLEPTHDFMRDTPGAFPRVLAAACALDQEGIPFNLITTVTKANLNELPDIEDVVVGLNAHRWLVQLGAPIGRLGGHPDLMIAPEDLPGIADFLVEAKRRNRVHVRVGDSIGYYSHHEPTLRYEPDRKGLDFALGCSAGCLNVGIESNGNVKGCLSLQSDKFVEGNVREESLATIWNKPGNFAYNREFTMDMLDGACKECEYGELCRGGCTVMTFGATGRIHANPYCLRTVLNLHTESTERTQ